MKERYVWWLAVAATLTACSSAGPGFCGDGLCRPGESESCTTCASDCGSCAGCGDGTCNTAMGEACASCPADCGSCAPTCGNGTCDGAEVCSTCPGDCGACSTSCTAANCAGCCSAGVCTAGTSSSACGGGGNVCMTCGGGLVCSFGACVVDPASRWNVVLDSLTVSSTNYAGAAWDIGGGAPDPVVDIRVASDTATPTRVNGPDDVFSITYVSSNAATNIRASDLQAELRFDALDEDLTDYEFIGACRFTVGDATFTGSQQTVTCPVDASTMNSGFTLRFHLEQF